MPSPDGSPAQAPVVHVERTADPTVLQWVCTAPALSAMPTGRRTPPPGSGLGDLLQSGRITEIAVLGRALRVRAADAGDWGELAMPVNDLVLAALTERAPWILAPGVIGDAPTVSLTEVQRVIDAASAAVSGAHGGALTAVAIEHGQVVLQARGACHGCGAIGDTLERLVVPALRQAFPHLQLAPRT